MAYEVITRDVLFKMGLAYVGQTPTRNRYGDSLLTLWVNEGVRNFLWPDAVEDYVSFTTVAGTRNYNLPAGFLREKQVKLDGDTLEFRRMLESDYSSTGYSKPGFYYFWGKPNTQMFLGPDPPDGPWKTEVWFVRTPEPLVNGTDVPELHPQWATAPALWVGHRCLLQAGAVQDAQLLLQNFQADRDQYREFMTQESGQNFLTTADVWSL